MDITSANASLVMTAPLAGLVVPVVMQGWAADDAFDTEALAVNEVSRGLDGKLSAGFVYGNPKFTISFQSDSPSVSFFDALVAAMTAGIFVAPMYGVLTLPSLGQSWALNKGFLESTIWAPSAKKILQPRRFPVVWESVLASPVGLTG